jgi:hypothetical protein
MKYHFEVQTSWAPACGWLRSPYGRDTWDQAWNEAQSWARNAHTAGALAGVRIAAVED